MKKVYVSPSTQQNNVGIAPFTTEEKEMNAIADLLIPLLLKDGRFEVRRNSPSMDDVYSIATDSNNWGADIHIALHSNAGGGEGTEVYSYSIGSNSERLAKALYEQIAPLSPGKDRGIKYKRGLIEVGDSVKATSILIELAFHDNTKDATWMAYNHEMIAQRLYKGICNYYGYGYKALDVTPTVAPSTPVSVDKDGYLMVRVLDSKAGDVRSQIRAMGYACEPIKLP
jgi:N-acetylmuramoyl-L-alanine amidase